MQDISGGCSPGIFLRAYYGTRSVSSSLYFYDCTFQRCVTTDSSSEYAGGSVIRTYAADRSQLRMENCKFYNNRCDNDGSVSGGGAIFWKSAIYPYSSHLLCEIC